jgi:hypothetical protein
MDTKHPEKEKKRRAILTPPNNTDLQAAKHDASAMIRLRSGMSSNILRRIPK